MSISLPLIERFGAVIRRSHQRVPKVGDSLCCHIRETLIIDAHGTANSDDVDRQTTDSRDILESQATRECKEHAAIVCRFCELDDHGIVDEVPNAGSLFGERIEQYAAAPQRSPGGNDLQRRGGLSQPLIGVDDGDPI